MRTRKANNATPTKYPRRHYTPPSPQDMMLKDFLSAKTPHEKREVIRGFNALYYIFGDTQDPRNPYEEGENHE